jgi:hypothetical protein
MKVYLVGWEIPYEGGEVVQVFATRAAAEAFVTANEDPNPRYIRWYVDEWEVTP